MRIAHIPTDHPYVRSIDPSAVIVGDPWNVVELQEAGVDVVHVHFGFEHLPPSELSAWIDHVRSAGLALVHTVHDIDNPHLVDQRDHHERTSELVRRSDVVITLTRQAGHEIQREWGRRPKIVAHPAILPQPLTRDASRSKHLPVLVWMSTLRPNLDMAAIERLVAESSSELELVVRRAAWVSAPSELRSVVSDMQRLPNVTLSVIDRLDDHQLADRVAGASVLVLAYAWGTHSGLVELATDVGTPAVTTPGGAREDQGAYVASKRHLAACVDRLVDSPPAIRRTKKSSIEVVRREHRRLYDKARRRSIRKASGSS